jgi:hypothetical protein
LKNIILTKVFSSLLLNNLAPCTISGQYIKLCSCNSQYRSSPITKLILLILGNWNYKRWHDIHTKFYDNPQTGSNVLGGTDTWTSEARINILITTLISCSHNMLTEESWL